MLKLKSNLSALALTGALLMIPSAAAWAQQPAQGNQPRAQHATHDQNNDGRCDVCGQPVGSGQVNSQGQKANKGKHFGPGDGTGNQNSGPQDGTGYGAQSGKRLGPQDGSGPQHSPGTGGGTGQGRRGGRS